MKKFLLTFLFAVLTALGTPASATQYVATHGRDSILLDDTASCPAAVQKLVAERGAPPELVSALRGFTAVLDGKAVSGCWVPIEGSIALVWEDGDVGRISQSLFHKLKEA